MAVTAGLARTAPMPVEGPAALPDFVRTGADSTSKPQPAPARATAPEAGVSGGTPVDAPATISAFSSETGNAPAGAAPAGTTARNARIQAAMEPEKVFGTDQSDVPLASPAQLARELARASAMAVRRAFETAPPDAGAAGEADAGRSEVSAA